LTVRASILVSTRGRSAELAACLSSLDPYTRDDRFEVVVVDNNGRLCRDTRRVIAAHRVRSLVQPVRGLARSLNAGAAVARGETLVFTDDDVVVDERWLDQLLGNFADARVGYVSGQVLPQPFETEAQRIFESKGGLSKGTKRRELDPSYFRSVRGRGVPVYLVAMGANSAIRTGLFRRLGGFDERFGAGSFIGAGNAGELCYRVLESGWSAVFDPLAAVHHRHEPDYARLHEKLFRYGCADTALQMKYAVERGDLRGLVEVLRIRPARVARRLWATMSGRSDFPIDLIIAEAAGNVAGPVQYLLSRVVCGERGR
jgi:GT2 family glycosyltransferase